MTFDNFKVKKLLSINQRSQSNVLRLGTWEKYRKEYWEGAAGKARIQLRMRGVWEVKWRQHFKKEGVINCWALLILEWQLEIDWWILHGESLGWPRQGLFQWKAEDETMVGMDSKTSGKRWSEDHEFGQLFLGVLL